MQKKVLILGANGLLGQNLLRAFHGSYETMGTSVQEELFAATPGVHYRQCDITQRAQLKQLVKDFVPNYIINAAAYTDVDGCETDREQCWKLNATAVGHVAEAALQVGARLVHMSTDYVFDGSAAPYTEMSRPQPLGYYGRSKLAGENALLSSGANHAIARTMVLYGTGVKLRPNFVTWLISQLRSGRRVRVVTDQFGNPTLASELAMALRQLAETGRNGVLHLCGAEIVSRYEFARRIAEVFELDAGLIAPVTTAELGQTAPRPANSGFDISMARQVLGVTMSTVTAGLQRFRLELQHFPDLIP